MKLHWMTSAVLTLGVSAVPALAGEIRGVDSRDIDAYSREVRLDHVEFRERDGEICEREHVPHRVIETAERFGNGRHIDSILLIRREHSEHYIVHMSRRDKETIRLHIERDGDLVSIER